MKFKVGDTVQVKRDLLIGKIYYNEEDRSVREVFSESMKSYLGKEGVITAIHSGLYKLDFARNWHGFTDTMIQEPVDYLAQEPYGYNREIEELLEKMLKLVPEQLINHALATGNKTLFDVVSKQYYQADKSKK